MADVKFEVTSVSLIATQGATQDIVIPGFGMPKAAIFIMSGATAADTVSPNNLISYGFTDGTRQYSAGTSGYDGFANDENFRDQSTTEVITRVGYQGARGYEYSFVSFTNDTVTIRADYLSSANSYICTVILIGGADVNVYVDSFNLNSQTPVDVTAPNFEPSFVLGVNCGSTAVAAGTDAVLTLSASVNDGVDSQRSTSYRYRNNQSVTNYTNDVSTNTFGWGSSTNTKNTISDYDAQGFTLTANSTSTITQGYLAIELLGDAQASLFTTNIPTSGNYSEVGAGFKPDFGMLVQQSNVNFDTIMNSVVIAAVGIAAFDSAGLRSISNSAKNQVGESVQKSYFSNQLKILRETGVIDAEASGYAFTDVGWDFTITNSPEFFGRGFGLAISYGAVTPGGIQEMYIKDGGVFVKYTPHVKVGGTFQEVDAYVLEAGSWVPVHEK